MIKVEEAIVSALPKNISFLSRDESGDLWVTKEAPMLIETDEGFKFLSYPTVEDMNNMQSLSVFNHLFSQLKNLDIVELKAGKSE